MEPRYTKRALKGLNKMPKANRQKLLATFQAFADDPNTQVGDVKKMQGRPEYRLRVGQWRAIFRLTNEAIEVLDIGPRGDIY